MKNKIYMFDIDGVVCTNTSGNYDKAKPFLNRIKKINELFMKGNTIKFFTSRGTTTGIDWSEVTNKQFIEWGILHDGILFGKPQYDIFVDDKGVSDEQFFKR